MLDCGLIENMTLNRGDWRNLKASSVQMEEGSDDELIGPYAFTT